MTTLASNPPVIASDWWFIGIDETAHWNLPEKLSKHIKTINTVYVFNRNEHTHCCELTPSYWMSCVDYDIIWHPEFYETPNCERLRDYAFNLLNNVARFESDCYMHVRSVEALLAKSDDVVPRWRYGASEDDLDTVQAELEALFEYWHGCPRF